MKKYTKEEFLKAAEIGEVSMTDAKHTVSLLDEARIILNTELADSAVRDALSKIIKVSVMLVGRRISPFIEDWDLPQTTTKKVKRKIISECEKWNKVDREKAITLKDAYDVLLRHFR